MMHGPAPTPPLSTASGSEQTAFHQLSDEDRLEHLSAIIESSQDAIFSTTLDGRVLSWNNSAARIYGYAAQEILGQPILKVVPECRVPELQSVIRQVEVGQG